ncbi:Hypothetical predicted protein [Cloeon dipterum]|uniref:F-box domain-containing protein n=1 Tax=Cloeon dipterum TaxID=197152 RepID=A0A8S1DJU0_9INSE|nr:Hypothetical predicted protein [Cloeon dipterum]
MTRIYCEKLLCWAANLAPNIEELTIKRNHAFKMKITPERGTVKMLEYFNKMQNLKRLFVEIYSFTVSQISNLRHTNVKFNSHADVHTTFPNITDLMVDLEFYSGRDNEASDSLLKFTKIKSLNLQILEACPFPIRDRFWETYGKDLHTLILFSLYEEHFIDLNSVFKYCPKLEKLSLIQTNIMMPQPTDFFAELKEFEWKTNSRNQRMHRYFQHRFGSTAGKNRNIQQ